MRGARLQFGGSPWARWALLADEDRAIALAHEAQRQGVSVGMIGKTQTGPWVVRVGAGSRVLRFTGDNLHDTVAFGLERWAAGADDSGIAWRGGVDRLAHAHPVRGRQIRTLCEQAAVPENAVWPELRRCNACWRALDRRTVAA